MTAVTVRPPKAYKGAPLEGPFASWYARNSRWDVRSVLDLADRIAAQLPRSAAVLEIAPGPGYLAVEMARRGLAVSALDISRAFVRIGSKNAREAGVNVIFRQGDAAAEPFADNSFDFLVCRAAFKNFSDPVGALREFHRLLRPGGVALIIDMRRDATDASIRDAVSTMGLGPLSRWVTAAILRSLRRRAYSRDAFTRMITETPFCEGALRADPLGFEIELAKRA